MIGASGRGSFQMLVRGRFRAGGILSLLVLATAACTPETQHVDPPLQVLTRAELGEVKRLVQAQMTLACAGHPARAEPGAIILADVTGDGRQDIVLNHFLIRCLRHPENPKGGHTETCGVAGFCAVDVIRNTEWGWQRPIELATWGEVVLSVDQPRTLVGSDRQGNPVLFIWDGARFLERRT
jgi:hypothetical protein